MFTLQSAPFLTLSRRLVMAGKAGFCPESTNHSGQVSQGWVVREDQRCGTVGGLRAEGGSVSRARRARWMTAWGYSWSRWSRVILLLFFDFFIHFTYLAG